MSLDAEAGQGVVQTLQRWLVRLGLWQRMALGISLGFLVLFAAFGALGERALHNSIDRILEERLIIAQMAAGQFDELLRQTGDSLAQTRQLAAFDPHQPDLSAESHLVVHTFDRMGAYVSAIVFLDAEGHVVLSQPPELYPPGTDLAVIVQGARPPAGDTAGGTVISAPFRDPVSDQPVVAITTPIYDGARLLGWLSGLLDLSKPSIRIPLDQAATVSKTGHALLVDDQGRVLAATFPIPFLAPGEHATLYQQVLSQAQAIVEVASVEVNLPNEEFGHQHVMAVTPLRTAPWGVAVGGDVAEIFAGVRNLRLSLALLSAIVLVIAWTATLAGARRLVRPVQRLTAAAQRVVDGDLQTPLQASEGGEIGAMAATLERMRRQLLANIVELANLNENLETRVVERTEALQQQQALTQQLLRRVITAQEEERARLSQELHDEIGQTLTAVQLSLDRLAKALPAEDETARERLARARALTEQALVDLRHMITALRPGVLDQLGLVPALGWVADHTLRPLGLNVTIEADHWQNRLPDEIETILFRIAQEAMSNVARHSGASLLAVRLTRTESQVTMSLRDNGCGFDLSTITAIPEQGRGLGLAGMQERASLAGGQVIVQSAPGQGTTVQVVVPLASAVKEERTPETDPQTFLRSAGRV